MGVGWAFFKFLRWCDVGHCCVSSLPARRIVAWSGVLEDVQQRAERRRDAAEKIKEGLDSRLQNLRKNSASESEIQRFVDAVVNAEDTTRYLQKQCRMADAANNDLDDAMGFLEQCMDHHGGASVDANAASAGQSSGSLGSVSVPADNNTVRAFDRLVGSIETLYVAFREETSDDDETEVDATRLKELAFDIMQFGFTTRQPETFGLRDETDEFAASSGPAVQDNTGAMMGIFTNWM